jgi:amidase
VSSLSYRTASDLTRALAGGELSSLELTDHLLERVERLNPRINAVVATAPEAARERAREADAARARGESWGPLHGLPMTIKDAIEVVGMPTTSGAPELANHVPACDADTVQRLVDAGAIVFGKTNLPLYASDLQSYNDVYGTTNNPWNPERGAGGSSGGSAAALAAGFTPLELGSDIGGSIRNPAHFCGVYGHKSSWGIVSGRGHIPGPPGSLSEPDLAVLGPMARCADDLALGLQVLAGPPPHDARAWRLELPASRCEKLSEFRVGLWLEQPGRPLARDVADRIQAAADRLAPGVARLDEQARPEFDAEASHARYLRLLNSVMGAGLPARVIAEYEAAFGELDPSDQSTTANSIRGAVGPHRAWLADDEARQHLRARWADFFEDFDVLLCPIMPTPAFPHDHSPIQGRTLLVDDEEIPYFDQLFWAGLTTIAYLPSTVAPVGLTPDGLPVGMQIVSPYLDDATAIHFARCIEDVVGGFQAPPGFVD